MNKRKLGKHNKNGYRVGLPYQLVMHAGWVAGQDLIVEYDGINDQFNIKRLI